ncbi:MAG TPA: GAF domain-containing protein [Acidobacteriota bacterium]|nr:GAF domain-containing protein [Acidobacteriota bacterium]
MIDSRHRHDPDRMSSNRGASWSVNLDAWLPDRIDLPDMFVLVTRKLQQMYPITRGLLAVRESGGTRFIATASFSPRRTRKNLSLRLPSASSLFEKVAEGGVTYTESCREFFSGNPFERNLLLGGDTRSFVLQPLKHEGTVVGIIGYSSDEPTAFTLFEDGLLDRVAARFAARITATIPTSA